MRYAALSRNLRCAAVLAWALPAAAAAAPNAPDIVGGQPTTAWPGVGALVIDGSLCTAFAVAPQWVMTAAHCVSGAAAATTFFEIGADAAAPDATFAIDQITVHPNYNGNDGTSDLAVLHIKNAELPVTYFKVNSQSLTSAAGRKIYVIGYGDTSSSGGSGTKRIATTAIDSVDSSFIYSTYAPGGTCSGDSGGPAFVYDADGFPLALGVTAFGDQNCALFNGFQRVDKLLVFVDAAIGLSCHDGDSCEGILRNGFEAP